VPNYYTFVRPQQQQRAFEQQQQQLNRQQSQVLNQLQSNVQTLKLGPVTAPQVAPTGHGSWFNRPGSSTFLNTSGFYSQSPGGSQSSGGRR
jgi:hypothetical protein